MGNKTLTYLSQWAPAFFVMAGTGEAGPSRYPGWPRAAGSGPHPVAGDI